MYIYLCDVYIEIGEMAAVKPPPHKIKKLFTISFYPSDQKESKVYGVS